jgi:hypothetical protein
MILLFSKPLCRVSVRQAAKGGYVPVFRLRKAIDPSTPEALGENNKPNSVDNFPKSQLPRPILAVSDLANLCRDESLVYLADGLIEEIIIEENGRELIQRIWRYKQPVKLLIEGLRKAGLELI